METFYFEKTRELKNNLALLKEKLNVSLVLKGRQLLMEGEALNEFTASKVLEAMLFGFSAKKALQLTEPDMDFKKLNIKDFTRRKDMEEVRGRIIGKEGKTKQTVENVSGCHIELRGNELGVLCSSESMDDVVAGLKNLIKGSKQANVYSYLERRNAQRRKLINETTDLGLKIKDKKEKSQEQEDAEDLEDQGDEEYD